MSQWFLIAFGGALGAMARFLALSSAVVFWGRDFPYGTLLVNGIGCFFAGLVLVIIQEKSILSPHYQSLIIVGFLGAFTTFSTFSVEVLELMQMGEWFKALLNVLLNVFVAILAAYMGMWLARS